MMIRDATADDLTRISEIYNESVMTSTASFALEPETMDQREAWFAVHGPTKPVIVCEIDGQVAGWASLSEFRVRPGYRFTVENSVYIDGRFHRRGIGRALTIEIIGRARSLGYRTIVAGITSDQAASIGLHESLGFTKVAHFKEIGFKFGRWLDVTHYQLMLNEEND